MLEHPLTPTAVECCVGELKLSPAEPKFDLQRHTLRAPPSLGDHRFAAIHSDYPTIRPHLLGHGADVVACATADVQVLPTTAQPESLHYSLLEELHGLSGYGSVQVADKLGRIGGTVHVAEVVCVRCRCLHALPRAARSAPV